MFLSELSLLLFVHALLWFMRALPGCNNHRLHTNVNGSEVGDVVGVTQHGSRQADSRAHQNTNWTVEII